MMSEAENPDRLKDYCASSVFIKALLLRGYGFDDVSFPGISFQNTVKKKTTFKWITDIRWSSVVSLVVFFFCRRATRRWAGLWATCWCWAICCLRKAPGWGNLSPSERGECSSSSSSSSSSSASFCCFEREARGRKEAMKTPSRYNIMLWRKEMYRTFGFCCYCFFQQLQCISASP